MLKSYVVLRLYDAFMKGEPVEIETCCTAYNISVPTFRRYIALLRDYFIEEYNYDLLYSKSKNYYYLRKNEPTA